MHDAPAWRKSSYSTEQEFGTCVEVAELGDRMGVRDSKNPGGPHLSFSREAWAAFVGSIGSRPI
ncbi:MULTISPECIES: DUF397 domain-containing protein [Nonomuraea]|jgi:hypothetical protein|uniref:DUF397 domain-containing protein n=2 Tax=Nonomuraea TaxID=83681 RepID=A0A7W5V1Q1_9ACTN|nr:DUF397 domain-containing protein [Nonomuraea dietziae]MBB3726020.1 hypothetical protein [Nonomuraea dietziae]